MNSMTGFGKAQIKTADALYTVELSSVNSRFLEFTFRTPRNLSGLEPKIRDLIQTKIRRGKLNAAINYERAHQEHGQYIFNQQAADSYLKQLRAYQKKRKLAGEIGVIDLLSIPDIVRAPGQDIGDAALWKSLKKAVGDALNEMLKMRQKEGAALAADLKKRLRLIISDLKKIENISAGSARAHRDRILERVNQLLDGPEINRQRLEEEVALLCERADITEEITRLKSHLDQFRAALDVKDSVGKRLNFILQEMNREVNTIGSKALIIDISKLVIGLKEEIERIREQVQNVE
ncbi:MAG: YicC family protein [candidate division Zixibacteria bacterium]|nr:YicC family protein [candidate division Zixibacteria bacterium]